MEYYEIFRSLREERNIKQEEAAKSCGMSRQQLHKYEIGKNDMSVTKFKALCEFYNISSDEVLGLSFDKEGDK